MKTKIAEYQKKSFEEYLKTRESTRRVMTEDGVPEQMQLLYLEGLELFERFIEWCRNNKREYLADSLERMRTDFVNETLNHGDC